MLADAVKGQLVRSHLEAFVRQLERLDFFLMVDQNVVDPVARLANKVLVPFHQRIEVLRAPAHQDLQLLVRDQLLEVAINRPEADAWEFFPHPLVDLIGSRVRLVVPDRVPDDFELFGLPRLFARLGHDQATKSSARDFCASGVNTARAR